MAKLTPEERRARNAARMRKWRAEHKDITTSPEWRRKTNERVKRWYHKHKAKPDGVQ